MNKDTFIRNIIPKIKEASYVALSDVELKETANYIWLYKINNCEEHFEVNSIITKNDIWNEFESMRSLNDHGYQKKIKGITPKFFAIVCRVLSITAADGNPLVDYEKY